MNTLSHTGTCWTCGQAWPEDTDTVPVVVAAQMLGISRTRVYQLLAAGKLEKGGEEGVDRESVIARLRVLESWTRV